MTALVPLPAVTAPARGGHAVGLIGEGIGRSLTPAMHEAEAAHLGIPYEYHIVDLLELGLPADAVGPLLRLARDAGYAAMNITHPCKQLAAAIVDELGPDAERLGAVNLVVLRGDRLIGHNTDWRGFGDGLRAGLPDASRDRVTQLGAGGAGAATAYAVLASGAQQLTIADLDLARASELAQRLAELFPDRDVRAVERTAFDAALGACDGFVHATPIGMAHHPGVAIDIAALRRDAWVADVVYRPLETELIRQAAAAGHATLDGGRMAVGQAAASLEIITGVEPDRPRMEAHFRRLIDEESGVA